MDLDELMRYTWDCMIAGEDVKAKIIHHGKYTYIITDSTPEGREFKKRLKEKLEMRRIKVYHNAEKQELLTDKGTAKALEGYKYNGKWTDEKLAHHFNLTKEVIKEEVRRITINRINNDKSRHGKSVAVIIKKVNVDGWRA